MSTTITDNTAGTQRFAVDNSANTEIGPATPTSEFSVNGRAIMSGTDLAQAVVAPKGMARITGAVTVGNDAGPVSVTFVNRMAGFGSIAGSPETGGIANFSTDKKSFSVYSTSKSSVVLSYSVF